MANVPDLVAELASILADARDEERREWFRKDGHAWNWQAAVERCERLELIQRSLLRRMRRNRHAV